MINDDGPPKMMDNHVRSIIDDCTDMLVPWYLMAALAYYHANKPFITDGLFDEICKRLNRDWDIVSHRFKQIVDRDSLSAGTCLLPLSSFPKLSRINASRHIESVYGRQI